MALATGIVALALGSVATAAAYSDQANVNLGTKGIGFPDRFDIALVDAGQKVRQADAPDGVAWPVAGADDLVPGHTITTTIPVFNNTPSAAADTTFDVVLRNTDGTVAPGVPNITPHLRFTAKVGGVTLFSNVGWRDAHASLGTLAARGGDALNAAATYVPGASGSRKDVVLSITYLDEPGVEALNGGQSALAVRFQAESVAP